MAEVFLTLLPIPFDILYSGKLICAPGQNKEEIGKAVQVLNIVKANIFALGESNYYALSSAAHSACQVKMCCKHRAARQDKFFKRWKMPFFSIYPLL